jgi:hypothetical protein
VGYHTNLLKKMKVRLFLLFAFAIGMAIFIQSCQKELPETLHLSSKDLHSASIEDRQCVYCNFGKGYKTCFLPDGRVITEFDGPSGSWRFNWKTQPLAPNDFAQISLADFQQEEPSADREKVFQSNYEEISKALEEYVSEQGNEIKLNGLALELIKDTPIKELKCTFPDDNQQRQMIELGLINAPLDQEDIFSEWADGIGETTECGGRSGVVTFSVEGRQFAGIGCYLDGELSSVSWIRSL